MADIDEILNALRQVVDAVPGTVSEDAQTDFDPNMRGFDIWDESGRIRKLFEVTITEPE